MTEHCSTPVKPAKIAAQKCKKALLPLTPAFSENRLVSNAAKANMIHFLRKKQNMRSGNSAKSSETQKFISFKSQENKTQELFSLGSRKQRYLAPQKFNTID